MRGFSAFAWVSTGVLLLLSSSASVSARPFFTTKQQPANFAEAFVTIHKTIPEYLKGAQCGGSDMTVSVEGRIAKIKAVKDGRTVDEQGLPGVLGKWNEDPAKGMALRTEETKFVFPTNTQGMSTTCQPRAGGSKDNSRMKKTVWDDGEQKKVEKEFQYPYFEDPPCAWRHDEESGAISPEPLGDGPNITYKQLTEEKEDANGNKYEKVVPHMPKRCEEFGDWLNRFKYKDCFAVVEDENGNKSCCEWRERYTCTDSWVVPPGTTPAPSTQPGGNCPALCKPAEPEEPEEGEEPEEPAQPGPLPEKCIMPPNDPEWKNAVLCSGTQCRCKRTDGQQCELKTPAPSETRTIKATEADPNEEENGWEIVYELVNRGVKEAALGGKDFVSYARGYFAAYEREKVEVVTKDRNANTVRAACYGFYDEFDPLKRQTVAKDRRCTLDIDVTTYRDDQLGKGLYATPMRDVNPLRPENQRNQGQYDAQKDLWFQLLGRAFSMLNPQMFQQQNANRISQLLLKPDSLDTASLPTLAQINIQGRGPLALSNRLRAFDDSGAERSITHWWQKQQIEASALFYPATVRLILPQSLARNIAQNDPKFAEIPEVKRSLRDPRSESVEVQLYAKEDLLGEIFALLDQSMLPLEEEPIPVIIPTASPMELRSLAFSWCTWHMRNTGARDCNNMQPAAKAIMDRLNEYADAVENVRLLRGEMYRSASALLDVQKQLSDELGEWLRVNDEGYKKLLEQQKLIQTVLLPRWGRVQEEMIKFHEITNAPWCMNQRFTTPVYSLLDEWQPARKEEGTLLEQGKQSQNKLPNIDEVLRPKDIVIDLSHIKALTMTGSLKVPVLKPVQVHIDTLAWNPLILEKDAQLPAPPPQLPSIPNLLGAFEAAIKNVPSTQTGAAPKLPLPEPIPQATLNRIAQNIDGIVQTLKQMNERYDKFWKSIGPLFSDTKEHPWQDAEREFNDRKKKLECDTWDDAHCQHVEMDFAERLQRIGSRPGIELAEDYFQIPRDRMTPSVCMPGDDVCNLLQPQVERQVVEWDISQTGASSQVEKLNAIRSAVLSVSLPAPIGSAPDLKLDVPWQQTLPSLNNPPTLNILP